MKTFKLKSLMILEHADEHVQEKTISLIDGLIINREDQEATWLIEAYVDASYEDYFNQVKLQEDVMIQVKITKETNEPATFITSIIGVNKIEQNINVLFIGKMVDVRSGKAQKILKELVDKGYEGKILIECFRKKMRKNG